MTDTAVIEQRLADAEAALHRLLTGESETSIRIGEKGVTYSAAEAPQLRAYIMELRAQLGQGGRRFATSVVLQ